MPACGRQALAVTAVALAAWYGPVACDDDDDQKVDASCTVGAKALELIGEGLRRGGGVKEILDEAGPGLDKACQAAVKVLVVQPRSSVELSITDPTGSEVTETVKGVTLKDLAPRSPGGAEPSCANYSTDLLFQLCINQEIQALRRSIGQ
jgi:hypothetical protein